MDLFVHTLEGFLKCPVCKHSLVDPVTLSCGYTVCQHCIPKPISNEQVQRPVFLCPVPECRYPTHLFGRSQESHIDNVIQDICLSVHGSSTAIQSLKGKAPAHDVQQACMTLLQCRKCHDTFHQPMTTHCGHVYCRLCLLKLKIEGESCPECQRPLPRYNHIQNQAAPNRILQKMLDMIPSSNNGLVTNNKISSSPVFVTGLVILPHQQVRLPVFMPSHIRMLRHAVISSQQYNALCLPAVHRGRPQLSQYGTMIEIVSVEQHANGSLILDVVGRERFQTNSSEHEDENMEDLSILISDIDFVPETFSHDAWVYDLAGQVHAFIEQIAASPPVEGFTTASTMGILGPLWFETMQRIHGDLPSHTRPAALAWWAATILPVSGAERYALLRTINLQDRLELVLSWIKQLDSQWKRCRQTAINSVTAVLQQQQQQKQQQHQLHQPLEQ